MDYVFKPPEGKPTIVDTYTIDLPGDVYGPENVDVDTEDMTPDEAQAAVNAAIVERFGQLAISEAEEQSDVFAIPSHWEATLVAGEVGDGQLTFEVKHTRYA